MCAQVFSINSTSLIVFCLIKHPPDFAKKTERGILWFTVLSPSYVMVDNEFVIQNSFRKFLQRQKKLVYSIMVKHYCWARQELLDYHVMNINVLSVYKDGLECRTHISPHCSCTYSGFMKMLTLKSQCPFKCWDFFLFYENLSRRELSWRNLELFSFANAKQLLQQNSILAAFLRNSIMYIICKR